ncbi:MAG: FkbM family methyltransferase [Magnetospirillum sp.]|nr:FkbM family methyltransferase [Magnetospirillum sp.]
MLKQFLLAQLDRPLTGGICRRLFGQIFRHRAAVAGLTNPFHVSHMVIERDGARYLADADSYLALRSPAKDQVAFADGSYEPELSYLMQTLIQPDDIVLDIGANIGLHTVAFARLAHRGHVFAFEPVAEMAERNSRNCSLNRLDNVTIVHCGLGEADSQLEMNVVVSGDGMEGTSSFLDTVHVKTHPERYCTRKVPVRRLDDVLAELEPKGRVGFIKIDTEGFEPLVLAGAMETIRRDRPALIVEAHSTRLARLGKSFNWYLETFPEYHAFVVPAATPANPYMRLIPLDGEPPEIAVNLLLLPRTRSWTPPLTEKRTVDTVAATAQNQTPQTQEAVVNP